MGVDRTAPGEELNTERPTPPREAATVIVLRGGARRWRCCSCNAIRPQRFMGGAWVFPGGAVDADEDHRIAGVREAEEEACGRAPRPEALIPFSRWITPAQVKIRFDTRFFLGAARRMAPSRYPTATGPSTSAGTPAGPRSRPTSGRPPARVPTIKTLERLAPVRLRETSCRDWASGREVVPVEPRVVVEGEVARVVLPGSRATRA